MADVLATISRLKAELDRLRPLPPAVLAQVEQKLRLESNYHSNAIEGNSLTLGETRSLILHGLTAHGKPLRDHVDIEGHDSAIKAIEAAVEDDLELNEVFIRNLHRVLLKEPYAARAETPDGRLIERMISLGDYKKTPNNVRTSTGETFFFTPPEHVKQAMSDLIDWYRAQERAGEHPIIIAATFHYRFARIHPFDDGNGRMARLLMNMILIKHGYTVALIRRENRDEYLRTLEQVDRTEDLAAFISYVASCCEYALQLYLQAARGEPIDDVDDIDKEIALFKQSLVSAPEHVFSAKAYVESVLSPFCEYCAGRIWRISDAFARARVEVRFAGTDAEGKPIPDRTFIIDENSSTLQSLMDRVLVPSQLSTVSAGFIFGLRNLRGRPSESIDFSVENNADAQRSAWRFSIDTLDTQWEHEGRELDALKRQFNRLLREVMKALERRQS